MPWYTNKETGGKFNTDWLDEDEKQKDRQIAENAKEADRLNDKKVDYYSYDNIYDMTEELYNRTGILVDGNFNAMNKDTMAETCTTLEDLQERFYINAIPDPNSDDLSNRLKIQVDYEYVSMNSFQGEKNENNFATAELCRIRLNPKYYKLSPAEFNAIYEEGTEGYSPFHPKGTKSKDIIAHEVAHHLLDTFVWEYCGHDADKYFQCQEYLTHGKYYPDNKAIDELLIRFRNIQEKLENDPDLTKALGGRCKLSARGLANPEYSIKGWKISKYAFKNDHELVAEAFADYYANGKDASNLSRMIVKELFGFE